MSSGGSFELRWKKHEGKIENDMGGYPPPTGFQGIPCSLGESTRCVNSPTPSNILEVDLMLLGSNIGANCQIWEKRGYSYQSGEWNQIILLPETIPNFAGVFSGKMFHKCGVHTRMRGGGVPNTWRALDKVGGGVRCSPLPPGQWRGPGDQISAWRKTPGRKVLPPKISQNMPVWGLLVEDSHKNQKKNWRSRKIKTFCGRGRGLPSQGWSTNPWQDTFAVSFVPLPSPSCHCCCP